MRAIDEYLSKLSDERRQTLDVRATIQRNLPKGFVESFDFGMLSYVVPLASYPKTYNKKPLMLAALAAQKSHCAVYLTGLYGDAGLREWFELAYKATGKRLDAGKSCVRFQTLEDLPLELVGEAITKLSLERFIALYEASRKQ
jgi:hypothetical protein